MGQLHILVTGANGFIAGRFIEKLNRREFRVYGLDQEQNGDCAPSLFQEFYVQDITQPFSLKQSFDFVFHLAALNVTHVGSAVFSDYHKVNVLGTKNLIETIKTKNFVFMSTAKVYGCTGQTADEAALVNPMADYEKSKLEAENICKEDFKGENLTIFRPVNIVGAGQAEKALLPVFFKNAVNNLPLEIFAPKGSRLQFLDVDDVINAFLLLIENKKAAGIFNLAPQEDIIIDELAQKIIRLADSRSAVRFSNNDRSHFCRIVSKKAEEVLGWKAQIGIEDILKRYHAAMKGVRA